MDEVRSDGLNSDELVPEIVSAAEELLSNRFGGRQQLSEVKDLGGSGSSIVLRARVAPSPFIQQRSVVLKYVPYAESIFDKSMMLREIVSYQFTTSLSEDVRPGPILLAHDVDKQLLIISDSGDGDTFAELLETNDEDLRILILRNLGEAIGKMHADTATKEEDFQILLNRMLQRHPEVQLTYAFRENLLASSISIGLELLKNAGIDTSPVIEDFARDAARRLSRGHHRAFTPFDLSPDNIIVADRTQFLDYEWAGFRDVAFDLACVIAGFPQFISLRRISDDEADVFVDSWVNEVADIWPNVRNSEHLNARIITALIGWALSSLAIMHFGADEEKYQQIFATDHPDEQVDVAQIVEMLAPISGEILNNGAAAQGEVSTLIRRDINETFEALQRYAGRNDDPRFAVVAQWAKDVCALVGNPQVSRRDTRYFSEH